MFIRKIPYYPNIRNIEKILKNRRPLSNLSIATVLASSESPSGRDYGRFPMVGNIESSPVWDTTRSCLAELIYDLISKQLLCRKCPQAYLQTIGLL